MQINPLFLIVVGAAIWTVGDIFIRAWVDNHKMWCWGVGIAIWAVGLLLLAESGKYKHLAVASTMMVIVNTIAFVIISWLFFKDQLNLGQVLGIVLGMIGLFLLEVS